MNGPLANKTEMTVGCLASAFEEAYEELGPMDVKKTVDGLSRSIIRNSRRRESFVLSDTHSWLGDISDQTFRARISHLIDLGILRKIGNTRATRYSMWTRSRTSARPMAVRYLIWMRTISSCCTWE